MNWFLFDKFIKYKEQSSEKQHSWFKMVKDDNKNLNSLFPLWSLMGLVLGQVARLWLEASLGLELVASLMLGIDLVQ